MRNMGEEIRENILLSKVDKIFNLIGESQCCQPIGIAGFVISNQAKCGGQAPTIIFYTNEQIAGYEMCEYDTEYLDDVEWNNTIKKIMEPKVLPDIRDIIKLSSLIQAGNEKSSKTYTLMKNFKYVIMNTWVCRFGKRNGLLTDRDYLTTPYTVLSAVDHVIGVNVDSFMIKASGRVSESSETILMNRFKDITNNIQ